MVLLRWKSPWYKGVSGSTHVHMHGQDTLYHLIQTHNTVLTLLTLSFAYSKEWVSERSGGREKSNSLSLVSPFLCAEVRLGTKIDLSQYFFTGILLWWFHSMLWSQPPLMAGHLCLHPWSGSGDPVSHSYSGHQLQALQGQLMIFHRVRNNKWKTQNTWNTYIKYLCVDAPVCKP